MVLDKNRLEASLCKPSSLTMLGEGLTGVMTASTGITRQQLSQHWKHQTCYEVNPWWQVFFQVFFSWCMRRAGVLPERIIECREELIINSIKHSLVLVFLLDFQKKKSQSSCMGYFFITVIYYNLERGSKYWNLMLWKRFFKYLLWSSYTNF